MDLFTLIFYGGVTLSIQYFGKTNKLCPLISVIENVRKKERVKACNIVDMKAALDCSHQNASFVIVQNNLQASR